MEHVADIPLAPNGEIEGRQLRQKSSWTAAIKVACGGANVVYMVDMTSAGLQAEAIQAAV